MKEVLVDEEDFIDFCNNMSVGKYISGPPYDYPCVIVYGEEDYEFVYLEDFNPIR